jgi:hypothetical protein
MLLCSFSQFYMNANINYFLYVGGVGVVTYFLSSGVYFSLIFLFPSQFLFSIPKILFYSPQRYIYIQKEFRR